MSKDVFILGPDGQPYMGHNIQTPTRKLEVKDDPYHVFSKTLLANLSVPIIQASAVDVETYIPKKSQDEEPDLVEKFASEFSITANGLRGIINDDPRRFIDLYARKYLNSQLSHGGVFRYSTVKGILEKVHENSKEVKHYQQTLKSTAEVEKLLKGIIDVYKVTKASCNPKSNTKLMTLNYIFFILKFIKFGDKKENLFSDEFLSFLIDEYKQEKDKDCKGFIEQFLAASSKRISRDIARELLENLDTECNLASNFAQTLFIQYPQLRKDFKTINPPLKEMSLDAILEQRDSLALIAQNSTNILSKEGRKGNLGFEIEMRLLEDPGYKNFQSLLAKFKYFCGLSYDAVLDHKRIKGPDMKARWNVSFSKISEHHELSSYGKGFKLNEFSFPALFQINQGLSFNANFVNFGSNHVHVDRLSNEGNAPKFSIINFRRGNYYENGSPYNKGWEAFTVPLSRSQYPQLGSDNRSLFFDTARFYDQMQVINGLYDIQVKKEDMEEFYYLLNCNDKEQIQHCPENFNSPKSQDLLSKFYIFIAKKYHKEDLIPNILRAWKDLKLPNISIQAYKRLFTLQNLSSFDISPSLASAFGEQIIIRDKELPKVLEMFSNSPLLVKNQFAHELAKSADFEGKLEMVCGYMTNQSGSEWKPLLEATKQELTLNEVATNSFYLNRFNALFFANIINLRNCKTEDLESIFKSLLQEYIPDVFFEDLGMICDGTQLVQLSRNPDIDTKIRKKILELSIPINNVIVNKKFSEFAVNEGPKNDSPFEKILGEIHDEKIEFAEIKEFYEEQKDSLTPQQKFLLLYHGFEIYNKEHTGKYPYLKDLQELFKEKVNILFKEIGYVDFNHPAVQFYFKDKEELTLEQDSIAKYAHRLSSKLFQLGQNIELRNLPNSNNDLDASILRLCLLMQRKVHVSKIDLKTVVQDFLELSFLAPSFTWATNSQRRLLDDLGKVKTENYNLDFSNYLDLYRAIIGFAHSPKGDSPSLELIRLKGIIAKKLSLDNLDDKQIASLEKIALEGNRFNVDKFYLIIAGKLKPTHSFKLQDENLKQFLKELSSRNMVAIKLVNYLEEFDFAELKNFISENPDISQENIAVLIKNLKQSAISFAEAEPYIASYAVHPKVRSAIFKLVDAQSLKERTKYGPISAKC